MGRSVSYPPGAVVAFRALETDHEDDWQWEYECLVEEVIETARRAFPSLELPTDGGAGRTAFCSAILMPIAGFRPIAAWSRSGSPSVTTVATGKRISSIHALGERSNGLAR